MKEVTFREDYVVTANKYMLVNTTDYDGGMEDAAVFFFDTDDDAARLSLEYEPYKSLKVGERLDCKDYDGCFIIRIC